MRYKNLFIDLDDTLWDTLNNNRACLEEIYADYHFNRHYSSFETFYSCYMPHNMQLWEQYRNHEIDRHTLIVERFLHLLRPIGIEDHEYALKLNSDFLERTTTKTQLVSGALDLLDYLRPSYKLYILSNGFREVQFKKLVNSGLASYFERMVLSEDAGIQKPHKGIFDFALINTNSRRNETLMIGDSWNADIAGAYQSKIDQLWLNPGGLPAKEFVPTYTVRSLEEIKAVL
jgi:putative hydrolase of the HAD superfamily